MNEEQLEKFLASSTPYHFTIHNECNDLASASINLESLTVSGKALEDEYIDAILYEDDYNSNLNTNKQLTGNTPNDENKVISAAKHAYSLYNFTLKANEERDFNLLLYMDPDTPMVDANMNASWKGKITLSTEYQEENTTIRQIKGSSDTNGMWGYRDKLTKIVIENKKSVKTAEDGGKVYGPFDESVDGYGGVQSYVVCDNEETDCIGYLQGTNGIKGNEDSSNLFAGFRNVTNIDGLKNINTSNVTNMNSLFSGMINVEEFDISMWDTSNVTSIDNMFALGTSVKTINISNFNFSNITNKPFWLITSSLETLNMSNSILPQDSSNFFAQGPGFKGKNIILTNVDTSHVTNMSSMFQGCTGLTSLDLSSFNTSNVTDMKFMFAAATNIQKLDLSSFNTENVTNMQAMFGGTTNLQSITFGPNFVHKSDAITSQMFGDCPAPERPTGDTWNDVSFD